MFLQIATDIYQMPQFLQGDMGSLLVGGSVLQGWKYAPVECNTSYSDEIAISGTLHRIGSDLSGPDHDLGVRTEHGTRPTYLDIDHRMIEETGECLVRRWFRSCQEYGTIFVIYRKISVVTPGNSQPDIRRSSSAFKESAAGLSRSFAMRSILVASLVPLQESMLYSGDTIQSHRSQLGL